MKPSQVIKITLSKQKKLFPLKISLGFERPLQIELFVIFLGNIGDQRTFFNFLGVNAINKQRLFA